VEDFQVLDYLFRGLSQAEVGEIIQPFQPNLSGRRDILSGKSAIS
jgi:hypothetical protein